MKIDKNGIIYLTNYNSPEIINKLSRENYKLVYYFSKNYIKKHKLNKEQCNDLIQEGFIMRTPRGRKATQKTFKHLGLNPGTIQGDLF